MPYSFVVYVDESGDEGFKFKDGKEKGSTKWFVLSAVIVRRANDHKNITFLDEVRRHLSRPARSHLHFRDLKHEQRVPFVTAISQRKFRIVSVLVHKPTLTSPEIFHEKYRLYFYFCRFLLERVSWFCRDHQVQRDTGDGSAKIVFSNRRNLSYPLLREYIDMLKDKSTIDDVRIDWSIIKTDQIEAQPHKRIAGLQIADAVASSMFFAAEINAYGFVESRYAEILQRIAYRHQGRYLGYGLKIFPSNILTELRLDERYHWIREKSA